MSLRSKAPTLAKVLSRLPTPRMKVMYEHSLNHGFHRGRQWFGVGMRVVNGIARGPGEDRDPCPVGAAFQVRYDPSKAGWFSAKLDKNLLDAIKHIVVAAGNGEDGMEQYLKELENTDPVELHQFVARQYRSRVASKSRGAKLR